MGIELTRRELGRAALAGVALAGVGGLAGCGSPGEPVEDRRGVIDRLPGYRVPKPVDFIRTNWSRDRFSLCSYSYLAPTRYGTEIRAMLAEPVGRVAFAGEATARIPATVHGAIQAGRTAAARAARELPAGSRVAVVGAGAAGLACAGALIARGLEPLVIEASDRIGGRVRSGDLDGSPVELGASWIHGTEGNALTGLAGEAGIGIRPFAYDLNFPVPGQAALGLSGQARYQRVLDSFDPRLPGAREVTVEQMLPRRQGPGLRWAVDIETAQEYGADPDQLASLATWEGEWLGGGDALLEGPYVDLLAGLAAGAETRFGFEVRRIVQGRKGVLLTGGAEEISADAAVVTVPVGVLKSGRIAFDPVLPWRTRVAIAGLGAGLLDKLWLAFEAPFWDENPEGFSWIDTRYPGRRGFWVNMVPVDGRPFLMTLAGGSDAHRLAGASDLAVVSGAMEALDAMFG